MIYIEKYRKKDGFFDLSSMLDDAQGFPGLNIVAKRIGYKYVRSIESIQPIRSKQAATIAVVTAVSISALVHNYEKTT